MIFWYAIKVVFAKREISYQRWKWDRNIWLVSTILDIKLTNFSLYGCSKIDFFCKKKKINVLPKKKLDPKINFL